MHDPLSPHALRALARAWLAEDLGPGDVTTRAVVDPDVEGRARLEARAPTVVCGLGFARACFEVASDGRVELSPKAAEGDEVGPGEVLATAEGPLAPILSAERTVLNVVGRLCGVADLTRRFVRAVEGTGAVIADTRKTTPGMRVLQKHAVRVGGGVNHRFGLYDGVLIKDNHIAACGGVAEAVRRARARAPFGLRVEVEVTGLDELSEALTAGADAVLLDNLAPQEVAEAVRLVGGRALVEVSGGITLDNVAAYAAAGPDVISVGALTHSAPAADLSLEVEQ